MSGVADARQGLSMLGWCATVALAAGMVGDAFAETTRAPELNAAQIVAKNVAARGGAEAWRKIETMVWVGHMEVTSGPEPRLGFVLEQKRPNKTRFEISTLSQKTQRVFDGEHGWKVRPSRGRGPDAQPFSQQENDFAKEAQGIDGPLIDYQSKGISVKLVGTEKIEGRKAYRLTVRLPSGNHHDVWIDAQTFLDVKYDRTSYSATGAPGIVSVFYRHYKTVEGLEIPSVLEIGVGSSKAPDKMVIEKIAINPPLDDQEFGKPGSSRRRMVTIDRQPERGRPSPAIGLAPAPASPNPDSSPTGSASQ